MGKGLLPKFSQSAYWFDQLDACPVLPERPLLSADVVIVGSGYTGLNAAIEVARAGRTVLVLDAGDPGFGCSTRNGGQIGGSIKPSLERLTAQYGVEKARAIRREGEAALLWIKARIDEEKIACDFKHSGRYHAAHTPQHYEDLIRDAEVLRREEGTEVHAVPRKDQLSELGSDSYYGGVVFADHASLHPAKYHRGLLQRAIEAGAHITGHCAALNIERRSGGFNVVTEMGEIAAKDVIVAANGYTTRLTPWLQRRVIPIGSNIITTEPLPAELMDRLFPTDRIASDTCKVIYYYRPSPDRQRIVFGGRVSAREIGADVGGKALSRYVPDFSGVAGLWHNPQLERDRRLYL